MTAVSRRIDARGLADYGPPGGHPGHRRSVAAWIALTGLRLEADFFIGGAMSSDPTAGMY
jgi:hypothetical protein